MAICIQARSPNYMRWYDSGDLQSVKHLDQICRVAALTPECQHLLPTKEYAFVKKYLKRHDKFPVNMTVRLSAFLVDGQPPLQLGLPTSVATRDPAKATCLAPRQGNKCLDCRGILADSELYQSNSSGRSPGSAGEAVIV